MEMGIKLVDFALQQRNAVRGALQPLVGAHDADIVPHEAAQLVPVVRDDHRFVCILHAAVIPARQCRNEQARRGLDGLRGGAGKHHAFQQRVARQPVGAVQPGAGDFADGKQARQVGAPGQVGQHAAAGEVRGGHHRNRLLGDVDAQLQAVRQDVRKVLVQELRALVRDVQVHAVQAVALHFIVDGTGHHVARRQFGTRVVLGHETRAAGLGRQQQAPALAAHRFADQERLGMWVVQARGVKLDEFHVRHAAAGAPGGGNAVAGGGVGVGGVEVHLAGPARGQNGLRRAEGDDLVGGFVERIQPQAALAGQPQLGAGDHIDQRVLLEHRDARRGAHHLDQRFLHGRAGGIGDMRNAPGAVAALACQVQLLALQREGHAQAAQPADGGGGVFHHEACGCQVAQAGTGHQRVFDVRGKAVVVGQHGGNTALRPAAGAVLQSALGDDSHPVRGRQVQGGGQAGQAAAHNQNVKVVRGHRVGVVEWREEKEKDKRAAAKSGVVAAPLPSPAGCRQWPAGQGTAAMQRAASKAKAKTASMATATQTPGREGRRGKGSGAISWGYTPAGRKWGQRLRPG